jgi:hypothetical protein
LALVGGFEKYFSAAPELEIRSFHSNAASARRNFVKTALVPGSLQWALFYLPRDFRAMIPCRKEVYE